MEQCSAWLECMSQSESAPDRKFHAAKMRQCLANLNSKTVKRLVLGRFSWNSAATFCTTPPLRLTADNIWRHSDRLSSSAADSEEGVPMDGQIPSLRQLLPWMEIELDDAGWSSNT